MKQPHHLTALDFLGVTTGFAGLTLDLKTALEIALLAVSFAAMAPLAFWRVRALVRDLRGKDSRHEPRD